MVVHTHVLAWVVYKTVAIRRRWVHILYTGIVLFSVNYLQYRIEMADTLFIVSINPIHDHGSNSRL